MDIKSIVGGLKTAGAKAAPAVAKTAGAVGAAGAGGKALAGVGAYAAWQQVSEAAKNISFLIVILGTIHYLLRISLFGKVTGDYLSLIFSLALFILAGYALSAKAEKDRLTILIPMLLFVIWYFIFGGNTDPNFLLYFGLISAALIVLPGLFTKGESVKPELLGFLPALFLFVDLGLIPWLINEFSLNVTPLMKNLVLYMPWWAFFGLLTLPSESTKSGTANFLINAARVIGIFYLIFVLVAPALPTVGYEKSLLPSPEELQQAQTDFRERFPDTENPAYSQFKCLISEPTNIQNCVKKRQEESEIKSICKQKGFAENSLEFEQCFKEEQEKRKSTLQVSGTQDPTIKQPTEIEFKTSEYFPKTVYQTQYAFPFQLDIKNPRQQNIDVNLRCFFKRGNKNSTGSVEPNFITINKIQDTRSIKCTPNENLNGTYTIVIQADLHNLTTTSRLNRLFIGNPELKTKQEIDELKNTYLSGNKYLSQAPNEFARLNFGLGEPETNPLIEYDDQPLLVSTIENVGAGKILKIDRYYIDIEQYGILAPQNCYAGSGENINLPKVVFRENIPLHSCFISNIPEELKNPTDFVLKEFVGTLTYDYQIQKEISIEVKTLPQ